MEAAGARGAPAGGLEAPLPQPEPEPEPELERAPTGQPVERASSIPPAPPTPIAVRAPTLRSRNAPAPRSG